MVSDTEKTSQVLNFDGCLQHHQDTIRDNKLKMAATQGKNAFCCSAQRDCAGGGGVFGTMCGKCSLPTGISDGYWEQCSIFGASDLANKRQNPPITTFAWPSQSQA